jgi:transposase
MTVTWTPDKTDAAYQALIRDGLSIPKAAEQLGVSYHALQHLQYREGWNLGEERGEGYAGSFSRRAMERADRKYQRALHKAMLAKIRQDKPRERPKPAPRPQPVFTGPSPACSPETRAIIAEVAQAYGVTTETIMGRDRNRAAAWPRQEVFYRLRHERGLSYPKIGAIFGRDHTTILHGATKHAERMAAACEMQEAA